MRRVAGGLDFVEADVVDVDEGGGVLDAVLHEVDEVGAAAEAFGSVCGEGVDGGFGSGGALVGEGIHAAASASELTDGSDDVGVGAAAADVAGHALADLVVGELGMLSVAGLEAETCERSPRLRSSRERGGGADLAGGAVAALEAVVREEGGLRGAEVAGRAEAFDGGDLGALRGDGEGEAGVDAAAVDEDGAGAALAVVAAFLAAGEVEVFAEEIEQRGAGVDGEGAGLFVDGEGDGDGVSGAGVTGLRGGGGRDADGDAGGDDAGGGDELAPGELEFVVCAGDLRVGRA